MQINNLRAYLANIGMSHRDFCVIIDINPTHLSQVISGKTYPSHRLAKDIYQATGGIISLPTRPRKRDLEKQLPEQSE